MALEVNNLWRLIYNETKNPNLNNAVNITDAFFLCVYLLIVDYFFRFDISFEKTKMPFFKESKHPFFFFF